MNIYDELNEMTQAYENTLSEYRKVREQLERIELACSDFNLNRSRSELCSAIQDIVNL